MNPEPYVVIADHQVRPRTCDVVAAALYEHGKRPAQSRAPHRICGALQHR